MMLRRHLMSGLVVPICLGFSSALAAPPPDYKGRPFSDEFHTAGPPAIPGIVQCALYDLGGEGVAYHDTTKENEGSDVLNRDPDHERAHGSHYVWHFRGKEGVDLSYVKDWADLNHPNAVSPPINLFYIGWTSDGEWTNYTVDVKEPGTYTIKALYSHMATVVSFDLNGKPAAAGKVPRATESWHYWDYGPIGTITFPEAGLQLLTFHYGRGNNWAFWVFEKIGPAAPAPVTEPARK
jgi:hypothetical protein